MPHAYRLPHVVQQVLVVQEGRLGQRITADLHIAERVEGVQTTLDLLVSCLTLIKLLLQVAQRTESEHGQTNGDLGELVDGQFEDHQFVNDQVLVLVVRIVVQNAVVAIHREQAGLLLRDALTGGRVDQIGFDKDEFGPSYQLQLFADLQVVLVGGQVRSALKRELAEVLVERNLQLTDHDRQSLFVPQIGQRGENLKLLACELFAIQILHRFRSADRIGPFSLVSISVQFHCG